MNYWFQSPIVVWDKSFVTRVLYMQGRKQERNTENKDHDNSCQIIMYVNLRNSFISVGLH